MKDVTTMSAPGKIILTGEYAVVFGKRGIAIPSKETVTVTWADDKTEPSPRIVWKGNTDPQWNDYVRKIFMYLQPHTGDVRGTLTIDCSIPLGKGMGSSTALVIAICKSILGHSCGKIALSVEDEINPGHSGIDFAVIWENAPILYAKNEQPAIIDLPKDLLKNARLVDTGKPNETTKELVAWMKTRGPEIEPAITIIGNCTERLLKGEDLGNIIRDHHRAQMMLGIVPEDAAEIIAQIEAEGGAAKIIGAGSRTGGGGMVLALTSQAQ